MYIGMNRVKRAGDGCHRDAARREGLADARAEAVFNLIRKTSHPRRLHIEVNMRQPVRKHGVQNFFQRRLCERPGKDADLHFRYALTDCPLTPTRRPKVTESSTPSSRIPAAQTDAATGMPRRALGTA